MIRWKTTHQVIRCSRKTITPRKSSLRFLWRNSLRTLTFKDEMRCQVPSYIPGWLMIRIWGLLRQWWLKRRGSSRDLELSKVDCRVHRTNISHHRSRLSQEVQMMGSMAEWCARLSMKEARLLQWPFERIANLSRFTMALTNLHKQLEWLVRSLIGKRSLRMRRNVRSKECITFKFSKAHTAKVQLKALTLTFRTRTIRKLV